jgi:biopolymer transport protein TolR
MALSAHDAFSGAGGGGRRRRYGRSRRSALSEINVTPLVDVMLVLLIIFMISAPLLTAGVPLELPKTEAGAVPETDSPLAVSVRADGAIFVQDHETPFEALGPALSAAASETPDRPVFVRADGRVAYADVARVMAALSVRGFTRVNLITDTGGPAAGPTPEPASPPGPEEVPPR